MRTNQCCRATNRRRLCGNKMEAEEEAMIPNVGYDPPPTRGFTTSTNQSGGFGCGCCRNCRNYGSVAAANQQQLGMPPIQLMNLVSDDDVVPVVTSNTNSGKCVYNPRPHTIATTSQEYVKPRID